LCAAAWAGEVWTIMVLLRFGESIRPCRLAFHL
jgi:hypothetical protein